MTHRRNDPVTTDYLVHRRGNDFSVGGAKIEQLFGWGSKNSEKQSNAKYNFMQYVFFEKGIRSMQWGLDSGAKPQKLGNFREFLC